jgi:hypothetical protein
MQVLKDFLEQKVSYQENTWSQISLDTTIESILSDIKSDKHKVQVENLREQLKKGNKDYYDNYKKRLPAVTFSATFNIRRTGENLKKYNPIIVIDIDKLDELQLINTFEHLNNDEYVITFWRSPSNNGFKGLVCIDYQFENNEIDIDTIHKSAFNKLSVYFLEKYNIELDKSGNDITRLCFLSYDIELVLKSKSSKFIITEEDIVKSVKSKSKDKITITFASNRDALYNPSEKNNQFDRKIMSDIIRYLTNKKLSITNKYEEWCKVGMAISNSFTYDIGIKYFLKLSSLDNDKFNEVTCVNFLNNCYETRKGNVNFNSIVYLANQKGYTTQKQKNGVPKAED